LRIVFTSDCHGRLTKLDSLPEGDVFVMAGDILPNFARAAHMDAIRQEQALRELDSFFQKLPYKHVLLVAGNHDWIFEKNRAARKTLKKITYLEDEGVTIDGIKFYGSPWQPEFCDWAFNLDRNGKALKSVWDKIPDDTDVLITHGPPWGHLDQIVPTEGNVTQAGRDSEHLGCELLAARVEKIKPRIHVFGHIHGSYGQKQVGETLFVNAALCNESYQAVNPPHVIDIEPRKTDARP
jgi:Icc-related predicted phosphoesterase